MSIVMKIVVLWAFVLIACASAVYVPRLQATYDKTSILRLSQCTLPCWIGIVPGQTTIGQARRLIQDNYDRAFNIEKAKTDTNYTFAFVLKISAKDDLNYLLVSLNDSATVVQDDKSLVHEITIYSYSDNHGNYTPTVIDMLLALGKPTCLAVQFGNYTAWPTMLYPQYQAKLSFGTSDFKIKPDLAAGLLLSDQTLVCNKNSITWRGFEMDYRTQFLESMLP